jgi:pyruvate-formate lyase
VSSRILIGRPSDAQLGEQLLGTTWRPGGAGWRLAFGIAGMSVVSDSLSAMKHAKVKVIRDATGLITDYKTEGTFPQFGREACGCSKSGRP